MAQRALKLGTRRSALARAQSAAIARELARLHPGLHVELVGIETRGDRLREVPLTQVEGKGFFTAEIDAALLRGSVDLTVHSFKDLSLERDERLCLAAVPRREPPGDVVLFAPDVRARIAAGEPIVVGSSSPRRASFVPPFLKRALPGEQPPGIRLVELRGNVDTRVRRLHEPHGSPRRLDAVVLAFAGIARLWADLEARRLLEPLLAPLPRMLLPLSECPAAPAQGALAVECRCEDAATRSLLAALEHAPTRHAAQLERALLAERGGGCQQRFGATARTIEGLGELLYFRDGPEGAGDVGAGPAQLRWTPAAPLPRPQPPVRAWDGSRAAPPACETLPAAMTQVREQLPRSSALFIAHRRALPEGSELHLAPSAHVWVPGVASWWALARRGVWVEGCADGLGFAACRALLEEPWLRLPAATEWTILTHAEALEGWQAGTVIATYRHRPEPTIAAPPVADVPDAATTHLFWASSAQFERWRAVLSPEAHHASGPGKTYEHLRRAGVHNLRMFPQAQQWREWLAG